jgi:hypothetical protein
VEVPFADELFKYFPNKLLSRTYFRRFLDYICASTALHQFQREQNDKGFYIATWEDYGFARIAFLKTVTNQAMIPLNRDQEELLRILIMSNRPMFVSEIQRELSKGKDWLYRNLNYLSKHKLVIQDEGWNENANRNIATFDGVGGLYDGCLLPPTERLSGFIACRATTVLKNVDFWRKQRDLEPLYEEYYIYPTIPIDNHYNHTTKDIDNKDNHPTTKYNHIDKELRELGIIE